MPGRRSARLNYKIPPSRLPGNISKTMFIDEIAAADRVYIINSQLHMGRFGGAGIKIIYFVFGLTGALLGITGFFMWLRRRKRI